MPGRIVVGVEAAEHASAALLWAVDEARLRAATLEVVHAWTFIPVSTPADSGLVPMQWGENMELLEAARTAAEDVVTRLVGAALGEDPDVDVVISVVEGGSGEALLTASEGAELLVVGNRGRGNLASAFLGSVSSAVSDQASCPVVIVREPEPSPD